MASQHRFIEALDGTLVNLAHVKWITGPVFYAEGAYTGEYFIEAQVEAYADEDDTGAVEIARGSIDDMESLHKEIIGWLKMETAVFHVEPTLGLIRQGGVVLS